LPFAEGERKRLVNKFFKFMFAFGKPNFRLSGQKLFFDFKNPYKIVANAEPERSESEATTLKNSKIVNWRYLLDKIRTYFEQNPDADF
jgi:hypothetical protein